MVDAAAANLLPGPAALFSPDHEMLKRLFSDSREASMTSRRKARKAYDYFHDDQLSAEVLRKLAQRGQPAVIDNRIKTAVNGILGVLEQGQSDPRAFPRNAADNDASEIATDGLRYAAEKARWQRTKLSASRDYLITGIAAATMSVDEDRDPRPVHIHWDEFFADPHSRALDYSDARYKGCAKWMYVDRVRRMFPQATIDVEAIASASLLGSMDEEDEDKPGVIWGDTKRNRVLVVDVYLEDNGWKHAIFYGGGILWAGASEHLDEKGRPRCGIEAQACYKDKDNNPYGVVDESMISLQDEVNMRRSKGLHAVNSRQVRQTAELQAPPKASEVRREVAKVDGVIPFGFEPVSNAEVAMGNVEMMRDAEMRLERHSPHPAVLGRSGENSSGRNNLIRQQAGLIELTPALGGIEDFELRIFRFKWSTIRQEWTEQKWIRTTDDIGAPKFLQVNEPVIDGMVPVIDPQTGQPQYDQFRQIVMRPNIVGVRNRPSDMDMDIIIDSTPDTANVAQEQFDKLIQLAGVYGPENVPFKVLVKASSLPNKRELLESMEGEGQKPPDPMMLATVKAKLDNTAADTDAKRAKAANDAAKAMETRARMSGPLGFMVDAPPPQPAGPTGF
jgi:hypothetical protein